KLIRDLIGLQCLLVAAELGMNPSQHVVQMVLFSSILTTNATNQEFSQRERLLPTATLSVALKQRRGSVLALRIALDRLLKSSQTQLLLAQLISANASEIHQ